MERNYKLGWMALSACALFMATVLGFCQACSQVNRAVGLQDDHPIEQALEEMIDAAVEKGLGVDPDIDLTP